ncbi:MAG TPA: MFS transporter [Candidatus Acidoferrum sp.]|nr:MFS transporter [Candidatus Acidoferrum sp.]
MATEANVGTLQERAPAQAAAKAIFPILLGISFCHLLNDTVQSLIPAVYPLLRDALQLNLGQVGVIALTSQFTSSILQPLVGLYTDRHPQPYSLAAGMGVTILGLFSFAIAPTYGAVLGAAALVGIGSAIFHPESSRVARLASGGQHGMAQSLFQVGGNAGTSLGPLLAAFVLRNRQPRIAWFSLLALFAMMLLARIGSWVKTHHFDRPKSIPPKPADTKSIGVDPGQLAAAPHAPHGSPLSSKKIAISLAVLVALLFSKFFYLASLISYYTFYLMNRFHLSVQSAQLHLSLFLGAVAVGTYFGGPVGDKLGRKLVIWWSILGVLPFTLILPYANLFWTRVLSVIIGLILASAFSAILVYGQELMPGRIGMVSGLFFGLAFGLGGIGSAALGRLADRTSIDFVYHVCAYLPVIGILTAFLPDLGPAKVHQPKSATA